MRPRIVALTVLVVASVLASGCLSAISCRVTGYEKHTATFEAPGLFDAMAARADADPRVSVRENALPGGLPVDDPGIAAEWEGLALRQVDWLGPPAETLNETLELTHATVHATGPASANVTVHALVPGPEYDVRALREDVRDAFDAFADVPRGDREALVDKVLSGLADGDGRFRSVSVVVDPAWLRVGSLYSGAVDEETASIRHPGAGEVTVHPGEYVFYLRSLRVAHLEVTENDHRFEVLAHSDGTVDAFRNRSPRGEDPARMSDRAFVRAVEAHVQAFGITDPGMRDLDVQHTCRAPTPGPVADPSPNASSDKPQTSPAL